MGANSIGKYSQELTQRLDWNLLILWVNSTVIILGKHAYSRIACANECFEKRNWKYTYNDIKTCIMVWNGK